MPNLTGAPAQLNPGWYTSRYAQPTIASATPVAWTTGNSPITLWTVTGSILCRVYGVIGATAFTSTGGTGTLEIGVTAATATLVAQGTVSGGAQFPANAVWVDGTPTLRAEILTTSTAPWVLVNNNIILTVATNSMTAGAVNLYLDWIPVGTATVVSGSP